MEDETREQESELYDQVGGGSGGDSMMSEKPWYLYLIECQDGSIYTCLLYTSDAADE